VHRSRDRATSGCVLKWTGPLLPSPSTLPPGCGFIGGYYCHTPNDQCVNDSDCASSCVYDATVGYWRCRGNGAGGSGGTGGTGGVSVSLSTRAPRPRVRRAAHLEARASPAGSVMATAAETTPVTTQLPRAMTARPDSPESRKQACRCSDGRALRARPGSARHAVHRRVPAWRGWLRVGVPLPARGARSQGRAQASASRPPGPRGLS
jgi:hypothetical protein